MRYKRNLFEIPGFITKPEEEHIGKLRGEISMVTSIVENLRMKQLVSGV
jgi:hypothetical protein